MRFDIGTAELNAISSRFDRTDLLGRLPLRPGRRLLGGPAARRAYVRFARANIQIYDARAVDLYERVCAQYLVGVKGAETTAKRS